MDNQQPSLKRKVQRLSREGVGYITRSGDLHNSMDEDIVQKEKIYMKSYGIIYCAYNKVNQKRYIGQTIQRLCERRANHYTSDPNIYFHRALRKYGKDDFEWTVIDTAETREELNEKEKYWIKFYNTLDSSHCYNLLPGGENQQPTKEQIKYARDNFVQSYGTDKNICRKIKNIKCIETNTVFKTAAEASRVMHISHSHITEAANGKLKTAGGYH